MAQGNEALLNILNGNSLSMPSTSQDISMSGSTSRTKPSVSVVPKHPEERCQQIDFEGEDQSIRSPTAEFSQFVLCSLVTLLLCYLSQSLDIHNNLNIQQSILLLVIYPKNSWFQTVIR